VRPSRVKASTRVRMTVQDHSQTPWGLEFLGPNRFRCHSPNSERTDAFHQSYSVGVGDGTEERPGGKTHVWLFRVNGNNSAAIPSTNPLPVEATVLQLSKEAQARQVPNRSGLSSRRLATTSYSERKSHLDITRSGRRTHGRQSPVDRGPGGLTAPLPCGRTRRSRSTTQTTLPPASSDRT
jgi:hypothetical protein